MTVVIGAWVKHPAHPGDRQSAGQRVDRGNEPFADRGTARRRVSALRGIGPSLGLCVPDDADRVVQVTW